MATGAAPGERTVEEGIKCWEVDIFQVLAATAATLPPHFVHCRPLAGSAGPACPATPPGACPAPPAASSASAEPEGLGQGAGQGFYRNLPAQVWVGAVMQGGLGGLPLAGALGKRCTRGSSAGAAARGRCAKGWGHAPNRHTGCTLPESGPQPHGVGRKAGGWWPCGPGAPSLALPAEPGGASRARRESSGRLPHCPAPNFICLFIPEAYCAT